MLIYKNGQHKKIHSIDYPGWEREGWSKNPQTSRGEESTSVTLINVNTANQDELTLLPDVGKVTANKIINARPIRSVEDLQEIQGLNVKAIADLITF